MVTDWLYIDVAYNSVWGDIGDWEESKMQNLYIYKATLVTQFLYLFDFFLIKTPLFSRHMLDH